MTNIKLYEDGGRLIIAIENPDSSIKDLIKGMFGPVISGVEKISNVAPPPKVSDENPPVLPDIATSVSAFNATNIVDETNRLINEQGYRGYITAYVNYNAVWRNKEEFQKKKVREILLSYQTTMRNRDIRNMSDDELKNIIRLSADKVFKNVINACMQQCKILSLEDFLESGRQNLEYAYRACYPIEATA